MKKKIGFSNLSGWLKLAVLTAWFEFIILAGAFIIGFIDGFLFL
jgi:hypothetical protein